MLSLLLFDPSYGMGIAILFNPPSRMLAPPLKLKAARFGGQEGLVNLPGIAPEIIDQGLFLTCKSHFGDGAPRGVNTI